MSAFVLVILFMSLILVTHVNAFNDEIFSYFITLLLVTVFVFELQKSKSALCIEVLWSDSQCRDVF